MPYLDSDTKTDGIEQFRIKRLNGHGAIEEEDLVAVESPLEIRLASTRAGGPPPKSLAITMRTPGQDAELALGFLYAEGILPGGDPIPYVSPMNNGENTPDGDIIVVHADILPNDLDSLERNFYMTSSCGICGKASLEALRMAGCPELPGEGPIVMPATIQGLPEVLSEEQALFGRTGGLHAAALFDADGQLCVLREDVGRHNALDKVIGYGATGGRMPFSNHILQVSGRASFELVQKALMAGIPIMSAVGAPSSLAVRLARAFGMTLLGFVRADRFNIYSGSWRIFGEDHQPSHGEGKQLKQRVGD